jgi:hypothetical protein
LTFAADERRAINAAPDPEKQGPGGDPLYPSDADRRELPKAA